MEILQIGSDSDLELHNNKIVYEEASKKVFVLQEESLEIFKVEQNQTSLEIERSIILEGVEFDKIKFMILQSFYDRVILVLDNGKLITVNFDTERLNNALELTDSLILDIKISQDQEKIVVVQENGQVTLLDKMLTINKQQNLKNLKYETDNIERFLEAQITWRYDSQFFNLIYKCDKGVKSMTFDQDLKTFHSPSIYNPEYPLVINYFEQYQKHLQCQCSWACNGSLIASVEIKDNIKKIALYEKNVLYYENFQILEFFQTGTIKNLFWHPYENILFINMSINDDEVILIYLKSNGKWKFKDFINFDKKKIVFHYFEHSKLQVFTSCGKMININLFFDADTYEYFDNKNQQSFGLGIFLEESTLALTPFDKYMIPPPLSFTQFENQLPIQDFDFNRNYFCYIDYEQKLNFGQYTFPDKFEVLSKTDPIEGFFKRSLKLIKTNECLEAYFICQNVDIDQEVQMNQVVYEFKQKKIIQEELIPLDIQGIDRLEKHNQQLYLLHEDDTGYHLLVYDKENKDFDQFTDIQVEEDEHVKKFNLFTLKDNEDNEEIHLIYINNNDTLYYNDLKIAEDCTSFLIYKKYFLYTQFSQTAYDHLYCQTLKSIHNGSFEKPTPTVTSKSENLRKRNIEKKSTLVCCSDTSVLFQLPRGNFEGIHHRIFLIDKIIDLLAQQNYQKAFTLIRKHKLNSNLLFDLNHEQFIKYIEEDKFEQDFSAKFTDQFILDLTDKFSDELEYVLDMESVLNMKNQIQKYLNGQSKVNMICDKILDQFLKNQDKNIKHIMVIFSKKNPQELERGLNMIKDLKDKQKDVSLFKKQPPHLQQNKVKQQSNYKDVLRYFSWLVNAENLFTISLQIYDLDLALMVAEFTQKDPKEYLPFIESLKQMDDQIEMKKTICLSLKSYEKAIEELSHGNDQQKDEAIDITIQEHRFLAGIKYFKDDQVRLTKIKKQFGLFLYKKKDYKNAVSLLKPFKEFQNEVITCYRKILNWIEGLQYMKDMNVEDKVKDDFCKQMEKELKKLKAFEMLAKIYKKLNKSKVKICELYLKAQNFRKAKQIYLENQEDFTKKEQEDLVKELKLSFSIFNNEFLKKIKNFEFWTKRLKIVQERKITHKLQGIDDDNLTLMSDITSVNSAMTGMSTQNSLMTGLTHLGIRKNKKPKNLSSRKYKENSVYEEEWLVESLNLLDITKDQEKQTEHLISFFIQLCLIDEVKEILQNFKKLSEIISKKKYLKTLEQQEFEQKNVELFDLYNHVKDFDHKFLNNQKKRKFDLLKKFEDLLQIIQ